METGIEDDERKEKDNHRPIIASEYCKAVSHGPDQAKAASKQARGHSLSLNILPATVPDDGL